MSSKISLTSWKDVMDEHWVILKFKRLILNFRIKNIIFKTINTMAFSTRKTSTIKF